MCVYKLNKVIYKIDLLFDVNKYGNIRRTRNVGIQFPPNYWVTKVIVLFYFI